MINAMQYAETYPLELEADYPYVAAKQTCAYDDSKA
jgi:hypothetical protein